MVAMLWRDVRGGFGVGHQRGGKGVEEDSQFLGGACQVFQEDADGGEVDVFVPGRGFGGGGIVFDLFAGDLFDVFVREAPRMTAVVGAVEQKVA